MKNALEKMKEAEAELAREILEASNEWSEHFADLASGRVPAGIAAAASRFAAARANASKVTDPRRTAKTSFWEQAVAESRSELGRHPLPSDLVKRTGKSRNACVNAISRLKRLGLWSAAPSSDDSVTENPENSR